VRDELRVSARAQAGSSAVQVLRLAVAPPIRLVEQDALQARERAWSAPQAKRAAQPDVRVLFWIRRASALQALPVRVPPHVAELVPVLQRESAQ